MAGGRPAGFGKGKQSPCRVTGCQSPAVNRTGDPPLFPWACNKGAHTSFEGKFFGRIAWIDLQLTVNLFDFSLSCHLVFYVH